MGVAAGVGVEAGEEAVGAGVGVGVGAEAEEAVGAEAEAVVVEEGEVEGEVVGEVVEEEAAVATTTGMEQELGAVAGPAREGVAEAPSDPAIAGAFPSPRHCLASPHWASSFLLPFCMFSSAET